MTVEAERRQVTHVLGVVEAIEKIAETLAPDDERRHDLLSVVDEELSTVPAIRPVIACEVLSLSRPTINAWLEQGILLAAERTAFRRTMLETNRFHLVWHILRELREAGQTRGLAEAVWHRLEDQELLESTDLLESIDQMRRGQGVDIDSDEIRARVQNRSDVD